MPALSHTRSGAGIAAALATLLIAGCSFIPKYERGPAPVGAAYPTGAAYTGGPAAAGEKTAAADIGWRDFLGAPRLQELVDIALRNNRDLRAAMLNVELLRAQYRIQSAPLFPQVSAFADGSRSRDPPGTTAFSSNEATRLKTWSVGASISWEIDLFGRLRSLKAAALEEYFASIQGQRAAQILLVSQVADQYLTLLASDELLEVTRRTLQTATASYDLVKLQFDTGVASELDLRQAQTVVEQARANEAAQLRSRAQAENALVLLLGQPQPAFVDTPARLGEVRVLADIPEGLPSDLLNRRPDVLQAEAQLKSANANIGAARAAFFPNISLTGSGGTASGTLSGLFSAGSAAWTYAPSVVESVFDGGANRANLRATKVARDIGVAQYEKAIQVAFREVADALAARGTYDQEIGALERFTDAQRRRLELAQLLYTNGNASYLDVLTAQTDLYNAEQQLVAARLERLTNQVDLYRALGGGWVERTGVAPPSPPTADAR